MFYKPKDLRNSLFARTNASVLGALENRPVVAYLPQGSAAQRAGVGLGHVLLSVNGVTVSTPATANLIIKESPRPVSLRFFVPNTPIVSAKGEFMVQYKSSSVKATTFACSWKPKYVVVGGILSYPWMIKMFRSQVSTIFNGLCIILSFWRHDPTSVLLNMPRASTTLLFSRLNVTNLLLSK